MAKINVNLTENGFHTLEVQLPRAIAWTTGENSEEEDFIELSNEAWRGILQDALGYLFSQALNDKVASIPSEELTLELARKAIAPRAEAWQNGKWGQKAGRQGSGDKLPSELKPIEGLAVARVSASLQQTAKATRAMHWRELMEEYRIALASDLASPRFPAAKRASAELILSTLTEVLT